MIRIPGERNTGETDHHILTYSKRIEWHNIIMTWFHRYLKGEEEQWYRLFPEAKN
ncbi:MAG: hypothetical protein LC649_02610 [Bacteroidales bacterium]|nr:hypothetical protein [Bacteroidales bacterium]